MIQQTCAIYLFFRLVTTAVTLIDPDEDFADFTTPSPKQNPLLTKTLKSNFDDTSVEGLQTPRSHQSNLLNQLQARKLTQHMAL